jgi:hypothetical protein
MSDSQTSKALAIRRLKEQLERSLSVRNVTQQDDAAIEARATLRAWQATRLARTHADLLESPRFRTGAQFFLADLYGPIDLGPGIQSVHRIIPLIEGTLQAPAIDTVADAIELDALSESLDGAMVAALRKKGGKIDAASYGAAYRRIGRREDRARQIDLISHVGQSLEKLTHARFVGTGLVLMRKPAQLAGVGQLHLFLERGYKAFRKMKDPREFVETVTEREVAISNALFAGDDSPLE